MARSPATLDPFAALAEPRRRRILEVLGAGRMGVSRLVDELHWPQPTVSKHLAVLLKVGLVKVERRSRQMIYEVDPDAIRTVHDWTRLFERLWSDQLARIKARAEAKSRAAGLVKDVTKRKEELS